MKFQSSKNGSSFVCEKGTFSQKIRPDIYLFRESRQLVLQNLLGLLTHFHNPKCVVYWLLLDHYKLTVACSIPGKEFGIIGTDTPVLW